MKTVILTGILALVMCSGVSAQTLTSSARMVGELVHVEVSGLTLTVTRDGRLIASNGEVLASEETPRYDTPRSRSFQVEAGEANDHFGLVGYFAWEGLIDAGICRDIFCTSDADADMRESLSQYLWKTPNQIAMNETSEQLMRAAEGDYSITGNLKFDAHQESDRSPRGYFDFATALAGSHAEYRDPYNAFGKNPGHEHTATVMLNHLGDSALPERYRRLQNPMNHVNATLGIGGSRPEAYTSYFQDWNSIKLQEMGLRELLSARKSSFHDEENEAVAGAVEDIADAAKWGVRGAILFPALTPEILAAAAAKATYDTSRRMKSIEREAELFQLQQFRTRREMEETEERLHAVEVQMIEAPAQLPDHIDRWQQVGPKRVDPLGNQSIQLPARHDIPGDELPS